VCVFGGGGGGGGGVQLHVLKLVEGVRMTLEGGGGGGKGGGGSTSNEFGGNARPLRGGVTGKVNDCKGMKKKWVVNSSLMGWWEGGGIKTAAA